MLSNRFESKTLIKKILRLSNKKKLTLYLVGGIVRDIFIPREKDSLDIDFSLKKGAIPFGRFIAKTLKGGFVILDETHGCSRVVKRIGSRFHTLDFTDFRGATIEEDLLHRDFSINSMALELDNACLRKDITSLVIDPYGGKEDMRSKVIRFVNKDAFDEDPLRILRAFSLAALLGFVIEKNTLSAIRKTKRKLSSVSPERVRDELFKILSHPHGYESLRILDKERIIDIILPEAVIMRGVDQGPYHHLDVWEHSLETVRALEEIMDAARKSIRIREYLDKEISSGRRRYELLKLAALLHDIGKPDTRRVHKDKLTFYGHEKLGAFMVEKVSFHLKLSNDEAAFLKRIVLLHLRPGYLSDHPVVTARAVFRFFRDAGNEAMGVLLLSLADERATQGRLTTRQGRLRHERLVHRLIKKSFSHEAKRRPKRLITGNDLMRHFSLRPSPLIGILLRELEELKGLGKIKTKTQALRKARGLLIRMGYGKKS